jgi:sialate O-acetylesterase
MIRKRRFILIPGLLLMVFFTEAQSLALPAIFGSHMVLQTGLEPPIWGKAKPSSQVVVDFNRQRRIFLSDSNGTWHGRLPEPLPRAIYNLTVSNAGDKISLVDIVGGDVYYAGGQSNMQYSLGETPTGKETIAAAAENRIRLFTVPRDIAYKPRIDINKKAAENVLEGSWQLCSPQTVKDFSAVAYFFASRIVQAQNIPVGIITSLGAERPLKHIPVWKPTGNWAFMEMF